MNSSYGLSSRNGVVSAQRVTPFVRTVQTGRSGTSTTSNAQTGRIMSQGKSGSTSQDKRS